jgi:hypothetical protein
VPTPFRLTQHARDRMRQRRITEKDIEAVLANPHLTYGDGQGNRRFVGDAGGRRIAVDLKGDPPADPPTVITVFEM